MSYPGDNPKAAMGAKKAPLHLVPPALTIGAAEAMADGAAKYGAYNFRDSGIAASVYMGAILRHLYEWWDGDDFTSDSNIHHMKSIAADVGLVLDAMAKGTFVDDRPTKGGARQLLEEWERKQHARTELNSKPAVSTGNGGVHPAGRVHPCQGHDLAAQLGEHTDDTGCCGFPERDGFDLHDCRRYNPPEYRT